MEAVKQTGVPYFIRAEAIVAGIDQSKVKEIPTNPKDGSFHCIRIIPGRMHSTPRLATTRPGKPRAPAEAGSCGIWRHSRPKGSPMFREQIPTSSRWKPGSPPSCLPTWTRTIAFPCPSPASGRYRLPSGTRVLGTIWEALWGGDEKLDPWVGRSWPEPSDPEADRSIRGGLPFFSLGLVRLVQCAKDKTPTCRPSERLRKSDRMIVETWLADVEADLRARRRPFPLVSKPSNRSPHKRQIGLRGKIKRMPE